MCLDKGVFHYSPLVFSEDPRYFHLSTSQRPKEEKAIYRIRLLLLQPRFPFPHLTFLFTTLVSLIHSFIHSFIR
jgi:hypothetical protein